MDSVEHNRFLDLLLSRLKPLFKENGYKRRGRTYNRVLEGGLVHVVNFQMSSPNARHSGCFAVNLGIFLPELHALTYVETPAFVMESQCHLRRRMASVKPGDNDGWWALQRDEDDLEAELCERFQTDGFPWLERLASREDIVNEWEKRGNAVSLPPVGSLFVAVILHRMGRTETAQALLLRDYEEGIRKSGRPVSVEAIAERLGLRCH